MPPAPAAEGGLLPQLLAPGRAPGRGNREAGTGPRPRRLRRGQAPPAVVRRAGQDDPPAAAAPAGRRPRPGGPAGFRLGTAGTVSAGPVAPVPRPALDRGVGQQPFPRAGPGHRLPARRGPRLEPARPGRDRPGPGRHARQPCPRREGPLVSPRAGAAAPRPERLPHRGDPLHRRAARRRPRPSPGRVGRGEARHAGACTAPPGPGPARPTPSASTSAASTRSWSSGPAATITCAKSPPPTSPRRSPRCADTSAIRSWSRCGP